MYLAIEQDSRRFREIIRGRIKRNLRKYISNRELIGRKGKDLVSIPVPEIELPHFRFGKYSGGAGQGEGKPGTPVGKGQNGQGSGEGQAGDQPGSHILEVELTLDELAEILGEELELPRIQPKGKANIDGDATRYTGIQRVGPEGLRHFKRTYREALKRQLISGTYDPKNPAIIPIREDRRYRSWKTVPRPENNAVVFYLMDVSGSMTAHRKELVRLTAFWIDTWLQANYRNLVTRYIVHDAKAAEVDSKTFYSIRENGGTRISSAYALCSHIIEKEYDPQEWNLYVFHFSDGENFGREDDANSIEILKDKLLPRLNQFSYGQVARISSWADFIQTLDHIDDEKLARALIQDNESIYAAIKTFLGKGL